MTDRFLIALRSRGAAVWMLAGVVLFAAALRLWRLASLPPGLYYDEAINGVDVRMILSGHGLPLYFAANNGREPLFIYLQALSVALLGYRPVALRLVSALAGIAAIPAVYFCARAILPIEGKPRTPESGWAPLIAAAGLAVSYWSLSLSRLGLRAVMLPLTSALAIGYFWLAWTGGSRRSYALAGFWLGLGLYTYTAARVLLLVLLTFVLVEAFIGTAQKQAARRHPDLRGLADLEGLPWRGRLGGVVVMAGVCLVLAVPLAAAAWQNPNLVLGRTGQVSVFAAASPSPQGESALAPVTRLARNALLVLRDFYDRGDMNARHNLPGRPANDPLLAVLFTAGCLACFVRIRRPAARLLLIWLVVMLLPTLLSGEAPHNLRAAGALPPLAVLYAVGAGAIVRLLPRGRAGSYGLPALLGLVILLSGWWTASDYFGHWAGLPQLGDVFNLDTELAAEETARRLGVGSGGSVLISSDLYAQPQLVFAAGVPEIATALPPAGAARGSFVLPADFDARQPAFLLWRGQDRVRVALLAPLAEADVNALHMLQESRAAAGGVGPPDHRDAWSALATGPLPEDMGLALRPIAVPLDVAFEGGLRLVGYDIDPPASRGPGEQPAAWLTTFWRCDLQANRRQMNETLVFLNLVHDGAVWQTANHGLPAPYLLPWPGACTTLIDVRSIPISSRTPVGKAYFETGLYLPLDSERRISILDPYEQGTPDQVVLGAFTPGEEPPAAVLDDLAPVGARLDGRLELAGWRARSQPGRLRVDLGWRSPERTGVNYTAFVHLIDGDGRIVAQHDGPPGGSSAGPTAAWAPGETVRTSFDLALPAGWQSEGQRLRVGLYLPATGQQAQVTDLPAGGTASNGGSFVLLPLGLQ